MKKLPKYIIFYGQNTEERLTFSVKKKSFFQIYDVKQRVLLSAPGWKIEHLCLICFGKKKSFSQIYDVKQRVLVSAPGWKIERLFLTFSGKKKEFFQIYISKQAWHCAPECSWVGLWLLVYLSIFNANLVIEIVSKISKKRSKTSKIFRLRRGSCAEGGPADSFFLEKKASSELKHFFEPWWIQSAGESKLCEISVHLLQLSFF